MSRLRGRPPGDRRPRRLPAGLARPRRPRRRPHRGGRRRRRRSAASASRSSSTASWPRDPGAGRARLLPQRRPGRALAADGGGELRPDFGPDAAAPARRRHPGHRPPAARRLQRRARQRRRRGRPRGRRRPARVGRRPAGGAGDRAAALQRPRPGLDQRPRPAGGAAGRRWSSGCGSWPRRSAPARSRRSWSASSPPPRSPATRRTCRSAASTPSRHVIERRLGGACDRAAITRFSHGPDQEEAPPQAPRHPGRPHRHQHAPRRTPQPRGGESPRPLQTQAGGPQSTCRRPGAARSSAASSPPSIFAVAPAADLQTPARRRRSPSAPSCSPSTSPPATTST